MTGTIEPRYRATPHTPRPWTPLTEALFDVQPPDQDAPDADHEWYQALRLTTGIAIEHLTNAVDRNYRERRGIALSGPPLGGLHMSTLIISTVFLEQELSPGAVNKELGRLVKTVGLVVHDKGDGPTRGWPMAPRTITLDEAVEVVDRAFHGIYTPVDDG